MKIKKRPVVVTFDLEMSNDEAIDIMQFLQGIDQRNYNSGVSALYDTLSNRNVDW
jgi:uncharacterized protein YktA (UPF0223 family)